MSVDISTLNYPIKSKLKTQIIIPENHFLVHLALVIPWEEYAELAIVDLYKDRKRSGPKLNLRLHLGAFILQTQFGWTDRELEENLNYYAPAKVFCGLEGKSYDHSAFVKFRGRISEETAKKFNTLIVQVAYKGGFTGTQFMDLDSTVQEANIEYPSDIRMMQSMFRKGIKILSGLADAGSSKAKGVLEQFNVKEITKDFKSYFFAKKSEAGFELKQKIFSKAHKVAKRVIGAVDEVKSTLKNYDLPWNYKKDLDQLTEVAPMLLKQINHFIKNTEVAPDKILSLHAKEVKCISKGKVGKPYEFGRRFFAGRLPGNYVMAFTGDGCGLEDAYSMDIALKDYQKIFDKLPDSVAGDQGFWSRHNLKACKGIKEIGITPRGHKNWKVSEDKVEEMMTRRSKVEPIIGHLKRRGMGKSKMKSDKATRLAGQRSALSLNLVRLARDLNGGVLKWAG
jgi:IS5 family transposase